MHKDVCLPNSANYAGIEVGLNAISSAKSAASSEIISVATSFGRAVVASRVPESDANTWAAGLQHQANDHRYYELTHDSLGHQFEHYYLLLQDHSRQDPRRPAFLMVNQDLVTGMPSRFAA